MLGAARRVVARVNGREPPAVPVDDESGQRPTGGSIAGACLEVDEMAGGQGGQPPGDEAGPRPEREAAPLAGLEEQVVEAVEGRRGRLGRGDEALPCPAPVEPAVVANDGHPVALGGADPLAGGLRDRLEERRLVGALDERQRDPVARRLDLLDRAEAGGANRLAVAAVGGGNLRIRRDDVRAIVRKRLAHGDLTIGERRPAARRRRRRPVRAAGRRCFRRRSARVG